MSAADVRRLVVAAEPFSHGSTWPDPQPLPDGLPRVPAFELRLLPPALRGWIADVAERMQCPPDYPAVAAMVAAASLIGRRLSIRPKRQDDWTVIPNLWGIVVGRPGVLKSPALLEVLGPLKAMETSAAATHRQALAEADAASIIAGESRKLAKNAVRKALESGDAETAQSLARQECERNTVPVRRRYLVNDTTVEKLGEILRDNPQGVLIFRDELIGFLRSFEREGREGDRAFYLEAWNGNGRYTYDRIGRGTIDIEACCVSILGAIPPSPLAHYLHAAMRGGGDDGLIQRFQLLVWPDLPSEWQNIDQYPDVRAKQAAVAAFAQLDAIDPVALRAESGGDMHFLRFDSDAQAVFDEWRAGLESRLHGAIEHPIIEAHLAKYRSLVPSLALVCHLLAGGAGPVTKAAVVRAAAWAEYLEAHARRLYWSVTHGDADATRKLADHIRRGDLPGPFGSRDVWRKGWSGLADRELACAAIDALCDLDWLREERTETAGRPKTVYHINPRVGEMPT